MIKRGRKPFFKKHLKAKPVELLGRRVAKTGSNRFRDFADYVQRRDFAGRNLASTKRKCVLCIGLLP